MPAKRVSAVISTWNKKDDVSANVDALLAQTRPPDEIIVVDNCSSDGTAEHLYEHYPQVRVIEMPHSRYGACETFNIGFKNARFEYTMILDDDVVLAPDWIELILARFEQEPESTAFISSKVIEPEMPESYLSSPKVNTERYMATFRGCGTMARSDILAQAGYYDERFFIYGNERDLSARVLTLGYRILQYPQATLNHSTPFGMKKGKRSLYYHVRNLWWYLFKHCSLGDIFRFFFRAFRNAIGKKGRKGEISDAVGTIGAFGEIFGTPGGLWVAIKATLNAFWGLPYCLKQRKVVRAADFELPIQ